MTRKVWPPMPAFIVPRFASMTFGFFGKEPPLAPVTPAPLTAQEAKLITQTVRRFYGNDAVTRNYGADPAQVQLHVETELDSGMEKYDCLGVLMTRIERPISMEVTKRGRPVHSNAKLAYRQGVIL